MPTEPPLIVKLLVKAEAWQADLDAGRVKKRAALAPPRTESRTATAVRSRSRTVHSITKDGLAYSYSVFSDYEQVRSRCQRVHILNTLPAGRSPYRAGGHVALLGVK
ncbi:MAG: hypothetical protein FJ104_04650 [Deltaproteobacteria bacterium]|nr:hypothetical protein [Deltaproteobacteria bacterium]